MKQQEAEQERPLGRGESDAEPKGASTSDADGLFADVEKDSTTAATPLDPSMCLAIAQGFLKKDEHDQAIRMLEVAARNHADDKDIQLTLRLAKARKHKEAGNAEAAHEAYLALLALDPSNEEAQTAVEEHARRSGRSSWLSRLFGRR